jgi:NAD(P)-dependent dehydrogenase (short-subunit alcohol dehydrogenase family)
MTKGISGVTLDMSGKTVIVTGGSRGIGAAVSTLFASAGANVVIDHLPTDEDIEGLQHVEAEIRAKGGKCEAFEGDVTSPKDMEELCRRAAQSFGGIDILVNSAGFTRPAKLNELTVDLWKKGIEVNLSGAFYATAAASVYMRAKRQGRIIYIGSAGSITGGGGSAAYSAAKAGINGLVRAMSKELAPQGITVNAILPAIIETDLLRDREPDPARRNEYVKRIPVGRLGQPEDVAYLALFLASPYASYVTGQNIVVDGGATYA